MKVAKILEWWMSGEAVIPFLLTNGIFGDGSNDYIQVQNSGGTTYNPSVSGSWTIEYWLKPPTSLSTQEGTFSSNEISTTANLINANYVNHVATAGYYFMIVEMYNSAGVALLAEPVPIPLNATDANRYNIHILLSCENLGGGSYRYRVYVNGVPTNITNVMDGLSTQTSLKFQWMNDRLVAGRFSDTTIMGTRFYSRTLSFSEVVQSYNRGNWSNVIGANCQFDFRFNNRVGNEFADNNGSSLKMTGVNFAAIASNMVTPAANPAQIRVVGDGNSMMYGTGSATGRRKTLPFQTMRALNNPVTYECVHNIGIAGQTTAQIIAGFPTTGALCYDRSKSKNIYMVWEGTNSLFFGASAATTIADLQTLWALARATGYKVVAMTILPRSNVGTPVTFEADRQTVNTWIRANGSLYDALADCAANTTIGDAGDETNATYYTDLVHMTDAGYAIVAGICATAIASIP